MEKLGYSKNMDGDGRPEAEKYIPPPEERTTNAKPVSSLPENNADTLGRRSFLGGALGGVLGALFGWHVLGPKMQEARANAQTQSSQPEPKPKSSLENPREQLRKLQLQDELNREAAKRGGIPESGPFAGKGR